MGSKIVKKSQNSEKILHKDKLIYKDKLIEIYIN